MPHTIKDWLVTFGVQAVLTFAWKLIYKLLENALIGWGDDQIAALFGIHSPTAATIVSWVIPFLLAAATLGLYHLYHARNSTLFAKPFPQRFRAPNRSMFFIITMAIGGILFVGSLALLYVENKNTNDEIVNALKRYVLPRHLSDEQKAAISGYVAKFTPVKNARIQVQKDTASDRPLSEPMNYAADIRDALIAGGWELSPISWADVPWNGVGLQFMQSAQSQQNPSIYNVKNPRPDQTLVNAFKAAKVPIAGGAGSSAELKEDTLTIYVGKRRMDDGDLIGKRRMREHLLRQADELKEE